MSLSDLLDGMVEKAARYPSYRADGPCLAHLLPHADAVHVHADGCAHYLLRVHDAILYRGPNGRVYTDYYRCKIDNVERKWQMVLDYVPDTEKTHEQTEHLS